MLQVNLRTPSGTVWELTGTQSTSPVLAPEGQFIELVGQTSRTDVAVPGGHGVLRGQTRYGAIQKDLEFFLHATNGEEMEKLHRDFRQAWSPKVPCVLEAKADRDEQIWRLDVVLDKPLPGPPVDMRRRTSTSIVVSVLNADGLWRSELQLDTGTVTVTNRGDVLVYPKIRYSGAGGEVVSPSGARFTLPAAAESSTVDLSPKKLRLDGAFPEGVPPEKSGTWTLPPGAALEWADLVADPWA